jgi:hypothetical protein
VVSVTRTRRRKKRCLVCGAVLDGEDDICLTCWSGVDEPAYDAGDFEE